MPREAVVAGQFYESHPKRLVEQISSCFMSKFGPGNLPSKNQERVRGIKGIISPHAGYQFSGACEAWSYKEIAESKIPDLYIILGLSHSGYPSCISLEDWETPLGLVKNDTEFGKALIKNSSLKQNEQAHQDEHSIEVQLPFLQFVNKDFLDKLQICPILVSRDKRYEDIAKIISSTIKSMDKKAIIIASSDFTHFGFSYGYFPFSANIKENMYKLDEGAIKHIKELNASNFLGYIEKTGATICGSYPIAVLIEVCRLLGAKRASLLKYYTSGDIINDYSSAVGYASVSIS